MNLLKFLKGLKEKNLPLDSIEDGSIYHCEDTGNTYLGKEIKNEDGTTACKELLRYSSAVGKTVISLDNNGKEIKGEVFNDYINNQALGDYSHAEGYQSSALAPASHAEGMSTEASGNYSHAEGIWTHARKDAAHAEGWNTFAEGLCSHSEGQDTTAMGNYSHAEGYGTQALSDNQHVQGRWNITDSENKYLHIVGNGSAQHAHSNAHTLDWEGNAWFAGDVYVKGSGQNDTENVHKLSYDSIEQQNTNSPYKSIKFWVGTQEELDTIEDRDDNCLYFTTGEGGEEGGGSGGPSIQTISLSVSNWDLNSLSQTANITGIIADPLKQIITVSPTSSSREEYLDCGVQCVSQGTDSLTFKAESIPNSNLSVYVAIQKANG